MTVTVETGAFRRGGAGGVQNELEEVRDIVDDVSPWMTPFYSNAPKTTIENTKYEWDTDELDAPGDPGTETVNATAAGTNNAWLDGANFTPHVITPTVRLTNFCQIQRKDIQITRRARKINKSGQRDELARQVTRKGLELRRDMETTLLYNQAAQADAGAADSSNATVPLLGGLPTWISGFRAERGGGLGADSANPGEVKVDGDLRAGTEELILNVVRAIYDESQELPNVLMLDTQSKQNLSSYLFSSSARVATQYQDQGKSPRGGVTAVGAVDVYVTDYCVLDIVPNRFNPLRAAGTGHDWFIYNTDYGECAAFDPMSTDIVSKRSDSDDRMIIVDHTLCVRNPKAFGTVADVNEALPITAS